MVASYYKPSGLAISGALAGTELVTVDNGGPLPTTVTTRQIANLAGAEEDLITTVSTVGAATLTGAAVVGGIIVRSGSQSNTAFSDAADGRLIAGRSACRLAERPFVVCQHPEHDQRQ